MIYVLHGSDAFSRSVMLAELKSAFPPDVAMFNIVVLDGRTAKLADVRTACEAYPMLHDRRLVIVHDLLKYAKSNEAREGLRTIIKHVPTTTDLVFNESDPPDARLAVIKDLQQLVKAKQAAIREYSPPKDAALHQWIAAHVRQNHATITPQAVQKLSDYLGNDLWLLHHEIVKLATFVGHGGTINDQIIEQLVADETETNLFAFIDSLCSRRGATAIQLLYSLLLDGTAPLYIISMIARQVRLMLAAQHVGRVSPDELARLLGQKPFVARKAAEQARNWTSTELHTIHHRLLTLDHGIKTGIVDAEGMLTSIVAELAFNTDRRRN